MNVYNQQLLLVDIMGNTYKHGTNTRICGSTVTYYIFANYNDCVPLVRAVSTRY